MKIRKYPKIIGMNNITSFLSEKNIDDYVLFPMTNGIDCIIANGKIRMMNGEVFKNECFQEDFKWFSDKVLKSKAVVYATIIENRNRSYRKTDFSDTMNSLNSRMARDYSVSERVSIEVYDIQYENENGVLSYEIKRGLLSGLCIHSGDCSVFVSRDIKTTMSDEKLKMLEIKGKIIDLAKENKKIAAFLKLSSKREGVILDPYEIVKSTIISFIDTKETDSITGESINVVKYITASVNEKLNTRTIIPYIGLPLNRRSYLYEMNKKGLLTEILYKTVSVNNENKYSIPC